MSHAIAGYAILTLFALAMNYIGTYAGLLVSNSKMADTVMTSITMLLSFLANTFVALDGSWKYRSQE